MKFDQFFDMQQIIGSGTFGDILLFQNNRNKKYYSMKFWEIPKITETDNFHMKDL